MTARSKIIVTVALAAGSFVAGAIWSIYAAGIGHGSYVPMLTVFPLSAVVMAVMSISGCPPDDALGYVLSLTVVQFATYGFVLGKAWLNGRVKKAVIVVLVAHAVMLLCVAALFYFQQRHT